MAVTPPSGRPTKGNQTGSSMPESRVAGQQESQGGMLPQERGLWGWAVYIFTFQWLTAWFQPIEKSTHLENTPTDRIKKLVGQAQDLLAGRIPPQVVEDIQNRLNNAPPQWLEGFEAFLQEAHRLESQKPDAFHLAVYSEEAKHLTNEFHPALLGEYVADNPLLNSLLMEIVYVTTINNTQKVHETLTSFQERDKPYFVSLYTKPPPFALQFAVRADEKMLHIADPKSKATRTLQFTSNQTEKEQQLQMAKAVYDLSHPDNPTPAGTLSDEDLRSQWLAKGNVYLLNINHQTILSLCPRKIDSGRAGFHDTSLIPHMRKLIQEGKSGEIMMPITTSTPEKVHVTVQEDQESRFCRLTLTYKDNTYSLYYPMNQDETTLIQLGGRITFDRSLERDLLLARSYFVRHTS